MVFCRESLKLYRVPRHPVSHALSSPFLISVYKAHSNSCRSFSYLFENATCLLAGLSILPGKMRLWQQHSTWNRLIRSQHFHRHTHSSILHILLGKPWRPGYRHAQSFDVRLASDDFIPKATLQTIINFTDTDAPTALRLLFFRLLSRFIYTLVVLVHSNCIALLFLSKSWFYWW